ncbi:hypothetical protein FXV83_14050 [Bradyrhizobium hipponense]|uniref:Uncharacterized protein n=1 Tax=Bradyrhizobium hipponense TaxID=2605638 RepID=A0A5S4YQ60_9BRAD|nr:hypothetical protein FXV83_14050 [Bradyrhizobium hipponense]
MPGLVLGIHAFPHSRCDVDGRDKPGHDGDGEAKRSGCRRISAPPNSADTSSGKSPGYARPKTRCSARSRDRRSR